MELTLAICMYNAEKYIVETLESVLTQTMQEFHLLIVDDCSTDGSLNKVVTFFSTHPRQYDLMHMENNQGLCYVRQYADCRATTRYMMFLDADDVLLPDAIQKMYAKITSDDDLMAVGCYLDYIDKIGRKIGGGLYLGDAKKESFRKRAEAGKLIFMQPTAIYDREMSSRIVRYENMNELQEDGSVVRWQDYCEDLDFWTKLSDFYILGKAIVVIPEVLCHYRKHPGGMSVNAYRMILRMHHVKNNVRRRRRGEKNLAFEEFYHSLSAEDIEKMKRDGEAADALRFGFFHLRDGRILKGVGLLCRSVALKPGYIWDKIRYNLVKQY